MRLVSWIGGNDLSAAEAQAGELGAVATTLASTPFSELHLLYNYPEERVSAYRLWLGKQAATDVHTRFAPLDSPIDFHDIYIAADALLADLMRISDEPVAVLLSSGTPAMQAVWILLGKTRHPVTFYQSTLEQGVQQVEIPFEISAEFVPRQNEQLIRLAGAPVESDAAFNNIVTQNPQMQLLKQQASVLAKTSVPVLVYGETGTGKELFATAIHNASTRHAMPFVAINCGAIPPELMDSALFGHVKGAFTGAMHHHDGVFKQAESGTLFLDEFGELPLAAQVRLLRVLQSGELTPIGANKPIKVNVRVIAATNRDLLVEVAAGRFREDLFYRIAVGVLKLPPLRQRSGDITLLAEKLLSDIGNGLTPSEHKKLSSDAKNLILKQPWRGNVRELQSTLLRASLWATDNKITAADIQQALFSMPDSKPGLLGLDVSQGIDIQELMSEIVQHYIPRALVEAKDNKTKAAELLGLKNYQTLNNWIEKYKVN